MYVYVAHMHVSTCSVGCIGDIDIHDLEHGARGIICCIQP